MTLAVRIDGEPVQWFYTDTKTLATLPAQEERHGILGSVTPLRSSIDGESANVSIELDNSEAQASALFFSDPPIGRAVYIHRDSAIVFSGVIQRVSLSSGVMSLDAVA